MSQVTGKEYGGGTTEINKSVLDIFRQILVSCEPNQLEIEMHDQILKRKGWPGDREYYIGYIEANKSNWVNWWVYWMEMDTLTLWQAAKLCISYTPFLNGISESPYLPRCPENETDPTYEMSLNALDEGIPSVIIDGERVVRPLDFIRWHKSKMTLEPLPSPLQLLLELVEMNHAGNLPIAEDPKTDIQSMIGPLTTQIQSFEKEESDAFYFGNKFETDYEVPLESPDSWKGAHHWASLDSWALIDASQLSIGLIPLDCAYDVDGIKEYSEREVSIIKGDGFLPSIDAHRAAVESIKSKTLSATEDGIDYKVVPLDFVTWVESQEKQIGRQFAYIAEVVKNRNSATKMNEPSVTLDKQNSAGMPDMRVENAASDREQVLGGAIVYLIAYGDQLEKKDGTINLEGLAGLMFENAEDLWPELKKAPQCIGRMEKAMREWILRGEELADTGQ